MIYIWIFIVSKITWEGNLPIPEGGEGVDPVILFTVLGYLSGSILYARVFTRLFGKGDIIGRSKDRNPGAANAFSYGGFWCGALTLLCDLAKGFIPVFCFTHYACPGYIERPGAALALAAPVVGHDFSVFYRFRGGKGIAVTFGVLLGLFPLWKPAALLAALFIFFSLGFQIVPHLQRTFVSYVGMLAGTLLWVEPKPVRLAVALIVATVLLRLHTSVEEREKFEVKLLWMR